jgi:hypothetical protein
MGVPALLLLAAALVPAQSAPPPKARSGEPAPKEMSARDYYRQLYDAGGFSKSEYERDHYVCFNDNAKVTEFFAFFAMAYDEAYAKAFAKSVQIMMQKGWKQDPEKLKEFVEAGKACDVIQKGAPYVLFLPDDLLNVFAVAAPELQKYLKQGGRLLEMHLYSGGVKYKTVGLHWMEDSWMVSIKGITQRLSIEPATLRYTEIDEFEALSIPVISHGACEEIPEKKGEEP